MLTRTLPQEWTSTKGELRGEGVLVEVRVLVDGFVSVLLVLLLMRFLWMSNEPS
jgi:hypothetical protein